MEVPGGGQEDEIPIPLNISYGGGHMMHHDNHHHHLHHHPQPPQNPTISSSLTSPRNGATTAVEDLHHHLHSSFKKPSVKYKECLKNHAAAMGGNATDGCGEFMPSGEEGSIEALTCSACNCHRNFHRKETEGETNNNCETCFHSRINGRKLFMGHPQAIGYHGGALISARAVAPHQMIMPYPTAAAASIPSESEEQDEGIPRQTQIVKKRFRTKFTQEQKEKMQSFAERVGWKIQKQEEGVVQQFCQEVGVKRRVLKVWMHNNKHNLSKKNTNTEAGATNPSCDHNRLSINNNNNDNQI